MKTRSDENWLKEFQTFMSADEEAPPSGLSDHIFTKVHADLNPASWRVFCRLALIQLIVGAVSLSICPQFGIGAGGLGLMSFFLKLGPHWCMAACGAFFSGTSALIAALLLRPEEIRVIRRTELLQFAILGLLSLGAFVCFGATLIFSIATAWLLGALIGPVVGIELGWMFRNRLQVNE